MSIKTIVAEAKGKVESMGGGEQFLGQLLDLQERCGARGDSVDFMVDLGEALAKVNLQLTSGAGAPEELYAKPLGD
jgi:hypothetical protein